MKTHLHYLAAAAIALPSGFLGAEESTKPAASVSAVADEASNRVRIRIEKDGKVHEFDFDAAQPGKAAATVADAIGAEVEPDDEEREASRDEGKEREESEDRDVPADEPRDEKKFPDKPDRSGFLGVALDDQRPEGVKGLEEGTGIRVNGVAPGSPAAAAGLQEGDVLVRMDDQILVSPEQLVVLVRHKFPGDKVRLVYLREGNKESAEVKLGETDSDPEPGAQRERAPLFDFFNDIRKRQERGEAGERRQPSVPLREWRRDLEESRQKVGEEASRAQREAAGQLKQELQRLREETAKMRERYGDAERKMRDGFMNELDKVVERLSAEVRRAADAAREARRTAEEALKESRGEYRGRGPDRYRPDTKENNPPTPDPQERERKIE